MRAPPGTFDGPQFVIGEHAVIVSAPGGFSRLEARQAEAGVEVTAQNDTEEVRLTLAPRQALHFGRLLVRLGGGEA